MVAGTVVGMPSVPELPSSLSDRDHPQARLLSGPRPQAQQFLWPLAERQVLEHRLGVFGQMLDDLGVDRFPVEPGVDLHARAGCFIVMK